MKGDLIVYRKNRLESIAFREEEKHSPWQAVKDLLNVDLTPGMTYRKQLKELKGISRELKIVYWQHFEEVAKEAKDEEKVEIYAKKVNKKRLKLEQYISDLQQTTLDKNIEYETWAKDISEYMGFPKMDQTLKQKRSFHEPDNFSRLIVQSYINEIESQLRIKRYESKYGTKDFFRDIFIGPLPRELRDKKNLEIIADSNFQTETCELTQGCSSALSIIPSTIATLLGCFMITPYNPLLGTAIMATTVIILGKKGHEINSKKINGEPMLETLYSLYKLPEKASKKFQELKARRETKLLKGQVQTDDKGDKHLKENLGKTINLFSIDNGI